MRYSMRFRLTILISMFIIFTITFFSILMLFNNRQQINFLVDTIGMEENGSKIFDQLPNNSEEAQFFSVLPEGSAETTGNVLVLEQAVEKFNRTTILLAVIFVLFSILSAYYLAGKALQPIASFKRQLEERDIHTLDHPFVYNKKIPQEILSLQHSFEEMSTRVSEAFDQQKRFTNNAAHELKTPIATMKAGIQMLRLEGEEVSSENLQDTLSRLESQLNRFTATIEDLEDLSLQEKKDSKFEQIEVSALIKNVIKESEQAVREKNLEVVAIGNESFVFGQMNLLFHACNNLFQNAIKYSVEQGKIIFTWDSDETYCYIRLTNTGEEIPKEDQKHIFLPFYRVDDSRSRETGGSGLGLSIVSDIMQKHGGKASLVCSENNQTIFQLQIPKKNV